jgi:Rrf2 family transcriptional regulator, nitric oxide-sensitive transcriptional repressor
MQLTRFTDYGLRVLIFAASHPDRLCSVREISDYYDISYNHLVKVVHRLAQLGHIKSFKGKGGGIQLAGGAENLYLGDLVLALEPDMNLVECFDRDANTCRITNTCQLKHYLFDARQAFINALNRHTLADTVKKENPLIILQRL